MEQIFKENGQERKLYDAINDPQFQEPFIDEDVWLDTPLRHRYVHGGFKGTETRFCFYFPEKSTYQGRFFQFLAPVQGDEKATQFQEGAEDKRCFSLKHGAYFVETNMGGIVNGGGDQTLMYRSSANCARFSRTLAAEMYGEHRPYGYVFGGSGGGFKTMSCAESTIGIWDGAVPFVIGSPNAMPNVFTARAHAMRLLRNKWDALVDAIEPGGSGDPYAVLNEEETAALKEVTLMGFPMDTWCVYQTIGEGALPVLSPAIGAMDAQYYQDFWEKDGYLGTEPGSSAVRDRIHYETTIKRVLQADRAIASQADLIDEKNSYGVDEAWKHNMKKGVKLPIFELEEFPQELGYYMGLKMTFLDGPEAGQTISALYLGYALLTGDQSMDPRDLKELLSHVNPGTRVLVDNSDYIAAQTYHRHQPVGSEYKPWDQFKNADGSSKYPLRPFAIGPILARGGAGSVQEGNPVCKVIVLESMMDESAFPWQGDWYRSAVKNYYGGDCDDRFRLWYMDHCMHTDCEEGNGGDHQHIVSYLGALYQALLDMSDWVERGIEPACTTHYSMDCGQVLLPETAAERGGVQPSVSLEIIGGEKNGKKIVVAPGTEVRFQASISLPAGSGALESVNWDFEMVNLFAPAGCFSETKWNVNGSGSACAEASHVFEKAGTYFPVIKAAANRSHGDEFTRIWNQDRVRVVVE